MKKPKKWEPSYVVISDVIKAQSHLIGQEIRISEAAFNKKLTDQNGICAYTGHNLDSVNVGIDAIDHSKKLTEDNFVLTLAQLCLGKFVFAKNFNGRVYIGKPFKQLRFNSMPENVMAALSSMKSHFCLEASRQQNDAIDLRLVTLVRCTGNRRSEGKHGRGFISLFKIFIKDTSLVRSAYGGNERIICDLASESSMNSVNLNELVAEPLKNRIPTSQRFLPQLAFRKHH